MKTTAFIILALALTVLPAGALDDSAFEAMDNVFETMVKQQEKGWNQAGAALGVQWKDMTERAEANWKRLRVEVEQKWNDFQHSTNRDWVEYDADKDTRSRVDFKEGKIEVTTLVPVEEIEKPQAARPTPEAPELTPEEAEKAKLHAKEKIEKQITKIFSTKNELKTEVLAEQVKDPEGRTVTAQNVSQFVKQHVLPRITVDNKPITAGDGKPRVKVTARIEMVPPHLEIRAGKYKHQVKKYADTYKLDYALVFAVIHTESYFNPLAKSWVPAYGLMQLVPKHGAMEAYDYLYGRKKILSAQYLYNPENNIMLGTTYLYLLKNRYFANVVNKENRRNLSIAAYNCGPTRVARKILGKYDVNKMKSGELVKLLCRLLPKETKNYILNVQKRIPLYRRMI